MKDAYYFPHFSNARNDRRIKRVRKTLGIEGYGIYFMILEVLRDQSDFRYPLCDVDLLADEFGTSEQKVVAVIRNFDLFEIDTNEMFFSTNLIKFLEPYLRMKEQRKIAGKASGEARRAKLIQDIDLNDISTPTQTNTRSTTVQRPFNGNEQSKVKESKEKKSKRNNTHPELEKLFPESQKTLHAEAFERVWILYGKRGSKKLAYQEWIKLSDDDRSQAEDHIPLYVDSVTETRYIKHFERYLKQRHFESEPPPKRNIFSGNI